MFKFAGFPGLKGNDGLPGLPGTPGISFLFVSKLSFINIIRLNAKSI